MKKINILIFMLAIFIISPMTIFAQDGEEWDSSGEKGGGAGIVNPCGNSCSGIVRWSSIAGVRITFVDANGNAVAASGSKSFDFTTYVVGTAVNTKGLYYNAYSGDRNKIAMANSGGNYSGGTIDESNIKKLSAVVAAYNSYVSQTSGHTSKLNTSGNTGGNLKSFSGELEWFLSLTKSTNTSYADDVNAFIKAIADVTGGFNADDLIYEVAEGCQTGEEIFIVMEPIFGWSGEIGGTWYNYFGTLSDSYYFFSGELKGGSYNLTNMAYLIYYEREISAYKGATGVSYHGYTIQSGNDLLSTAGYGLAVDWANNPGVYCQSCSFVDGKFSYDNKLEGSTLIVPSNFGSIQEYAFTSRSKGGAGCCELLKSQISSADNPSVWQAAYDKYCDNGTGDSCETKCVSTDPPVINVNNCCNDSTSSEVIEPELNDLFCEDTELGVTYYIAKCKADTYKVSDLNDYCELYCTERVEIEIPGAITATSGRYFKLTANSKNGKTSPYIEGYRRCRVKIHYNEWRDKYVETVQKEVDTFNEYQKQASIYKNYDTARKIKTVSESGTITASCSETTTDASGKTTTRSNTATANFSYSYDVYEFDNTYYYNTVKLSNTTYSSVKVVNDSRLKEAHTKYSTYGYTDALAAYNNAVSSASSSCGLSNVSTSGPDFVSFTGDVTEEDVKGSKLSSIKSAMDTAEQNYTAATKEGLELEKDIDECDYYFDDTQSRLETKGTYSGSNAEESYKFSPDVLFRYSQAYLSENGSSMLDTESVEFEKSCTYEVITNDEETDVDEIKEDQYSTLYGTSSESMLDLSSTKGISYVEGTLNLSNFYDYEYKAEKKFTTDAKYHAVCSWEEKESVTYTLVPSGLTSVTKYDNYTIHNREYKVYLSTYDGTYETYWDITNIGHNGKLTDYFKNGKTCANEAVSSTNTTLTCTIHVEHELVMTGKCNGSNDTDVTVSASDCDPQTEGIDLFEFKFVEGDNLFPSGTTTSDGEIAYNWTSTESGQKAMEEIAEKWSAGTTYSPENASYSFTLTTKDMKQIKNYNTYKESTDNGYNDFNLHCDETCGENSVSGSGCSKCKSYFLEDLANGYVTYNGTSHSVSAWSSSSSLEDIRNNNKW